MPNGKPKAHGIHPSFTFPNRDLRNDYIDHVLIWLATLILNRVKRAMIPVGLAATIVLEWVDYFFLIANAATPRDLLVVPLSAAKCFFNPTARVSQHHRHVFDIEVEMARRT